MSIRQTIRSDTIRYDRSKSPYSTDTCALLIPIRSDTTTLAVESSTTTVGPYRIVHFPRGPKTIRLGGRSSFPRREFFSARSFGRWFSANCCGSRWDLQCSLAETAATAHAFHARSKVAIWHGSVAKMVANHRCGVLRPLMIESFHMLAALWIGAVNGSPIRVGKI